MKGLGLLAVVVALAPLSVSAAECTKTGLTCASWGSQTVGGVTIENTCLELVRSEECTVENPQNECTAISPVVVPTGQALDDGQCQLSSEDCLDYAGGVCLSTRRVYECWNGPRDAAPARLNTRIYHNFQEDVVSTCGAYSSDANCTLMATNDIEPAETRDINTRLVTRSWWQRSRTYDCTNPAYVDSCDSYDANPICVAAADPICLDVDANGSCIYEERTYECNADPSFNANCEPVAVCVGENCQEIEEEPNTSFAEVATWLNFLDRMGDENNCDANADVDAEDFDETDCVGSEFDTCEPTNSIENVLSQVVAPVECAPRQFEVSPLEVFAGEHMSCGQNNLFSCCQATGGINCSVGEYDLVAYNNANQTHYLGWRCTNWALGVCVFWRRDYCVYKSKFGRVFQEQAHLQTGSQFRPQGSDDRCPALTIEQLEALDTGAMDFSEVYGDAVDDLNLPVEEALIEQLDNQMGGMEADVQDVFE